MPAGANSRTSDARPASASGHSSEPHPIYFRHGQPPVGVPSLEGGAPNFYMFRLSHVGLCAAVILLATFALLLVTAILFPVLLSSPHPQVRVRPRRLTARGAPEEDFVTLTQSPGTTTTISSIPPECVEKPCLPEAFYFKAKPQGLFSWQTPPCSDFYGFVCTDSLLNRTHPQWQPYKQASVGYLFRAALRYVLENVRNMETAENALAQVTIFVHNCSTAQTASRTREAFLVVLESVGLGGFPFVADEDKKQEWRLDEAVALCLRLLDVAPFFHVQLPNPHVEQKDILLTRHSPLVPRLEQFEPNKHLDRLISTWWALRMLVPVLRQQTMTDVEAVLSIFKDVVRASETTDFTANCQKRVEVNDLPAIHYWNWQRLLNTVFKGVRSFAGTTPVVVINIRYLRELATFLGQYEPRHILNFMALCVADELSAFFPERHSRASLEARLPYRDRSLPSRPQLCLLLAERMCPLGVEALLLQAVAGTSVREDLVKEFSWWIPQFKDTVASYARRLVWLGQTKATELEGVINGLKLQLMFSDAVVGLGEDLSRVECGYEKALYKHHPLRQYTEAYRVRLDRYFANHNSNLSFERYPPASSFEYNVVYDDYSNIICIAVCCRQYVGAGCECALSPDSRSCTYLSSISLYARRRASQLFWTELSSGAFILRKFYLVKILPDLVRTVARTLANAQDPKHASAFNGMRRCALGAYIAHPIPLLLEKLEGYEHWMYEDIMADHLSLAPYMELFHNLSQSVAGDQHIVTRGFSPYIAEHVAFFFFVESSCEPYTNHGGKPRSASLPSQTRVNGALSQYAPFAVSFFCPYGSAMAKEPCELYRRVPERRRKPPNSRTSGTDK